MTSKVWAGRLSDEDIKLFDSINYVGAEARGKVVVAGSHGGIYPAYKAAVHGVRAVILNDAGIGFQNAGIGCLDYCERIGMAAAVVSNDSARIGDAVDMVQRGIISKVNVFAENTGCIPGMACEEAAERLKSASVASGTPPVYEETRFVISDQLPRIICIDSASLVEEQDEGHIVITGSHGGLIGGLEKKAFNVSALVAVFNDAGVGIDNAGIGRLGPLDKRGIGAVTVAHTSARIGDSRSTYYEGIISCANTVAAGLGAGRGVRVKDFVKDV